MNANKIKAKLVENGHTQFWLAEQMKISANALSMKMNGKVPLTIDEAQRIGDILKLNDSEKLEIFLN